MICHLVSKKKMPLFLATIILMTGVASAVGPPLGGIFAESSMTWRMGFFLSIGERFLKGILHVLRGKLKVYDSNGSHRRVCLGVYFPRARQSQFKLFDPRPIEIYRPAECHPDPHLFGLIISCPTMGWHEVSVE